MYSTGQFSTARPLVLFVLIGFRSKNELNKIGLILQLRLVYSVGTESWPVHKSPLCGKKSGYLEKLKVSDGAINIPFHVQPLLITGIQFDLRFS